jgi:hypothetical protein
MAKLASDSNVISHWHHPLENFQTSAMEFYAAVELALAPKQIPDYSTSRVDWKEGGVLSARREYLRVKRGKLVFDICAAPFGTGYFFSWWLAEVPPSGGLIWALFIVIGSLIFMSISVQAFGAVAGMFLGVIGCIAALLGLGYLIHQGQGGSDLEDRILGIPFFGSLYERLFRPFTYYKMDTAIMFQSVVHKIVMDVIDPLFEAKGVRALTELERKPIMRECIRGSSPDGERWRDSSRRPRLSSHRRRAFNRTVLCMGAAGPGLASVGISGRIGTAISTIHLSLHRAEPLH